jgi:NAD(P)-dependent dehydrogenase (short-subunit alcohol dehydrogenase family)
MQRTVFITGASSGLGAATATVFAEHGWQVFAADIAAPGAASRGIPITVDVTDSESCAAAAREVAAHTDGLSAVINFAGVLDLGPLMEVSEERLRRILDVNVLGTHRVNRAMFDLVRAGGGRIVNISSEAGRFRAGLTSGPYSMSKHAVEAYSDALRQELMFVGIPVIVIEPGAFRTAMSESITDRLAGSTPPGSPFESLAAFTAKNGAREEKNARDPNILATAVYGAVTSRRPKPRYLVNGSMQLKIMELLPRRAVDRLVKLAVR